jgi:6-phosphogluconolactonase
MSEVRRERQSFEIKDREAAGSIDRRGTMDVPMARSFSRRSFLRSAAALATARGVPAAMLARAAPAPAKRTLAYAGAYTGAVGAGSNGEGIYLFDVDSASGELLHRRLAAQTPSPSWIAIHPSHRFLYAVNEVDNYGDKSGSVSAFAIDAATGDLRPLNVASSEGAGPAHMSIDATGRFALVANYVGGSIAVLPILGDGSLGPASDVHRDSGSLGSQHATNAPAGSFAISGHDAPHAHMILPDPQNRFVLASDLGQDRIYIYRFDSVTGKLTPSTSQPFVELPSGDGPRHFAFHPNGRWLYSIQEEASNVVFFAYNSSNGSLTARQTVSALPRGFAGTTFASEILISPDGKFLYAGNRLHDTIAVFAIGGDGRLTRAVECSTMGDYPSQFRIDPGGRFLYACNRRSDCITSFRIHPATGALTFTGQYTAVGSPGSITFLTQ